jgi:HEAT repeat protein
MNKAGLAALAVLLVSGFGAAGEQEVAAHPSAASGQGVVASGNVCPKSLDRTVALLRTSDSWTSWELVECLTQTNDRQIIPPLVQFALRTNNVKLVLVIEEELLKLDDPKTTDLLLEALKTEKTRSKATYMLGNLKIERAVNPLIVLLETGSDWDRRNAADALGQIGDLRAVEPLLGALKSDDEILKRFVADALGEIGDVRAVEPLMLALVDEDDGVRANAAKSLGSLRDLRAVESLAARLDDESETVQKDAADALGSIGAAEAVEPLIAACKGASGKLRWHASAALGLIDSPTAADYLLDEVKAGRIDVAASARIFFIRRGASEALPAMVQALQEYGNWEIARDYQFSGNETLMDAAQKWEARNNLEGLNPPGTAVTWGSTN